MSGNKLTCLSAMHALIRRSMDNVRTVTLSGFVLRRDTGGQVRYVSDYK